MRIAMKLQLLYFLLLTTFISNAQPAYQPRDTSYSINSSYLKIRKTHPEVRKVTRVTQPRVTHQPNLVYTDLAGERSLHLDVFYRKPGRKLRPAILMIHGGGWTSGSKENLHPMASQLAAKGYVTATPEYRMSAEAPYPAAVEDLKAAVRWLRANAAAYGIDTARIAAYGCSAGAHLAALLGTTNELDLFDANPDNGGYSASVQAVLNIDGIVSFVHPDASPEWTGRSANAWLGPYENPK